MLIKWPLGNLASKGVEFPFINAVPDGVRRPFWSVMIPTYNRSAYLGRALASVLSQDPGPDEMQIEVIDNCSTDGDPKAIVEKIGTGRVSFYRNPENIGMVQNWNVCIRRSIGYFVHILNDDDYVEKGFYAFFQRLINENPGVSLFACRAFIVDEYGKIEGCSPRLETIERINNDPSPFFYYNPFRSVAVVMRREFYEKCGGFCETLTYTPDWEMWVRAIAKASGLAVDKTLAYNRLHPAGATHQQKRNASALQDCLRIREIFSSLYRNFDRALFDETFKRVAFSEALDFMWRGDEEACRNNALFWWKMLNGRGKAKEFLQAVLHRDRTRLRIMRLIFTKMS